MQSGLRYLLFFCCLNFGCHSRLHKNSTNNVAIVKDSLQWSWYYGQVFTPNGDGINDIYFIEMSSSIIDSARLIIFNRLGDKVYEATEIIDNKLGSWDGNYQNKACPQGGYFVLLTYTVAGEPKEYSGTITIIR